MIFRENFEPNELRGSLARLRPEDRELVWAIVARGGDLTILRHVLVFLAFPSEVAARAAEEDLSAEFTTSIHGDIDDAVDVWMLQGETQVSIQPPNVAAMSDFCSAIAERHGGEFDGWECALVKTPGSRLFAWAMRCYNILRRAMFWRRTTDSG